MFQIDELTFYGEGEIQSALLKEMEAAVAKIERLQSFDYSRHKDAGHIMNCLSNSTRLVDLFFYALKKGDLPGALSKLSEVNNIIGYAEGIVFTNALEFIDQKKRQNKIAAARHKENRALKEDAIQYYKDNHKDFKNKDDAAAKIAEKFILAKFSTVRRWLRGVTTG